MRKVSGAKLRTINLVECFDELPGFRTGDHAFVLAMHTADEKLERQWARAASRIDDGGIAEVWLKKRNAARIELAKARVFVGSEANEAPGIFLLEVFHFREQGDRRLRGSAIRGQAFAGCGYRQGAHPSG